MGGNLETKVGSVKSRLVRRILRTTALAGVVAGCSLLLGGNGIEKYLGIKGYHSIISKRLVQANGIRRPKLSEFNHDFSMFCFDYCSDSSSFDIYVADLPSLDNVRAVAAEPIDEYEPKWSDDGKKVIYSTKEDDKVQYFSVNVETGEKEQIIDEDIKKNNERYKVKRKVLERRFLSDGELEIKVETNDVAFIYREKEKIYVSENGEIYDAVEIAEDEEICVFAEDISGTINLRSIDTRTGELTDYCSFQEVEIKRLRSIEGTDDVCFVMKDKEGYSIQILNTDSRNVRELFRSKEEIEIFVENRTGNTIERDRLTEGRIIIEKFAETTDSYDERFREQTIDTILLREEEEPITIFSSKEKKPITFAFSDKGRYLAFETFSKKYLGIDSRLKAVKEMRENQDIYVYDLDTGELIPSLIDKIGYTFLNGFTDEDSFVFMSDHRSSVLGGLDLYRYNINEKNLEQLTDFNSKFTNFLSIRMFGAVLACWSIAGYMYSQHRTATKIQSRRKRKKEWQEKNISLVEKILNFLPDKVVEYPTISSAIISGSILGTVIKNMDLPVTYYYSPSMTTFAAISVPAMYLILYYSMNNLLRPLSNFKKPYFMNFAKAAGLIIAKKYYEKRGNQEKLKELRKKSIKCSNYNDVGIEIEEIEIQYQENRNNEELFSGLESLYNKIKNEGEVLELKQKVALELFGFDWERKLKKAKIKKKLRKNPDDLEALLELAFSNIFLFREEEAIQCFEELREKGGEYSDEYGVLFSNYLRAIGKKEKANTVLGEVCANLARNKEPEFVFGESKNKVFVVGGTEYVKGEFVFKEGTRSNLGAEMHIRDQVACAIGEIGEKEKYSVAEPITIVEARGRNYYVMHREKGVNLLEAKAMMGDEEFDEVMKRVMRYTGLIHATIPTRWIRDKVFEPEERVRKRYEKERGKISERVPELISSGYAPIAESFENSVFVYCSDISPFNMKIGEDGTLCRIDLENTRLVPFQLEYANAFDIGFAFNPETRRILIAEHVEAYNEAGNRYNLHEAGGHDKRRLIEDDIDTVLLKSLNATLHRAHELYSPLSERDTQQYLLTNLLRNAIMAIDAIKGEFSSYHRRFQAEYERQEQGLKLLLEHVQN